MRGPTPKRIVSMAMLLERGALGGNWKWVSKGAACPGIMTAATIVNMGVEYEELLH